MRTSIIKPKDIQENNLYQSTEAIIKIIIDKLIYLSIRKSYSNNINDNLGNFCFKYIQNNINNMLEPLYIPHTKKIENKESNMTNEDNKKELFWKVKQPEKNTWVEIIEPEYFEIDRYEASYIKFKDIDKKEEEEKNKEKEGVVKKNIENSPKNKTHHRKSNFMKNNINAIKLSSQNVNIEYIDKKESNSNLVFNQAQNIKQTQKTPEKNISQNNNNTNNTPNINQNKKIQIIQFPSEDIPNIDEDNPEKKYNLPEVDFLRKEFQKELIKKEEEIKKKQKEEKEKKLQKLLINEKKNDKIFDSNKLTFDSNGEIISFKLYKIDNLKDFIIPKNFVKEHKKEEKVNTSGKKKPKNNVLNKTPMKIKLKEEEIIKNISKGQNQTNAENILKKPIEEIIPSGSNFKIISPDIGVVITEGGQFKVGSKEFSKYFKKYSLQDYDKMLNDYLPNINDKFLKTSLGKSNSRDIRHNILNMNNINNKQSHSNQNKRKSQDFLNNNEEITYNPLISSQIKENDLLEKNITLNNVSNHKTLEFQNSNMLSSKGYSKNNPLLSSFNNTTNKNLYTTNFDNFITMKKEGIGSLKLELDSLKDLTETNQGLYKNALTTRRYKNEDIIGNKFRLKNHSLIHKQIKYRNEFGNFNKRILTNKKWGNEISQNNVNNNLNTIYSKHQTKIQILRELGSNILSGIKIKLPRNRKVDLSQNINI